MVKYNRSIETCLPKKIKSNTIKEHNNNTLEYSFMYRFELLSQKIYYCL